MYLRICSHNITTYQLWLGVRTYVASYNVYIYAYFAQALAPWLTQI